MNDNAELMLSKLDGELNRKCTELRQKKKQAAQQRLFLAACIALLVIPVTLVFFGVNLLTVCAPVVIFLAVGLLLMSPALLTKQIGGLSHE